MIVSPARKTVNAATKVPKKGKPVLANAVAFIDDCAGELERDELGEAEGDGELDELGEAEGDGEPDELGEAEGDGELDELGEGDGEL